MQGLGWKMLKMWRRVDGAALRLLQTAWGREGKS